MKDMTPYFFSALLFLLVFPLQTAAEVAEVNVSEWEESAICAAKDRNSHAICLKIDAEGMRYREFSAFLSRLFVRGFYDISVNYKGELLNISSNGIENGLAVELPRPSEEAVAGASVVYPFSQVIRTESGECVLVYDEITASDPQVAGRGLERFQQYVLSLKRQDVGLVLFVKDEVAVNTVLEYVLSIRDRVDVKGVLFGKCGSSSAGKEHDPDVFSNTPEKEK